MTLRTCRKAARRSLAGLLTVPFIVGACNDPVDSAACTRELVHGIVATATDAETNADITGGAFLLASAGTYRDSVGATGGQLRAASEQPGTFSVTIGHPGYFSFVRNNVVVGHDGCHVIPVTLQAPLSRSPEGRPQ